MPGIRVSNPTLIRARYLGASFALIAMGLLFFAAETAAQQTLPGRTFSITRDTSSHSIRAYGVRSYKHILPYQEAELNQGGVSGRTNATTDLNSQLTVGDTTTFNTPLPLVGAWGTTHFTLGYESDSLRIWVSTAYWNQGVDVNDASRLATAIEIETPSGSIDENSGITANNTQLFGFVPDIDGDGILDVLWYNIPDDYVPGVRSFIPGLIAQADYDPEAPDGTGNARNTLYIDIEPQFIGEIGSPDAVAATTAAIHQSLIHYFFDPDEEGFLTTGLSEFAKTINGYEPVGVTYLWTPEEHNLPLLLWDGFREDVERASLFLHYLAEQVGVEPVAALTRDTASAIASLNSLASSEGEDLRQLIFDFHTANFVNDQSLDQKWGYTNERISESLPSQATVVRDASLNSSSSFLSSSLTPGGHNVLQWRNVKDLTVTIGAGVETEADRLLARAILQHIDGTIEVVELNVNDQSTTLTGAFEAASILIANVVLDTPATGYALSSSWPDTAFPTTNRIQDSGELVSTGISFIALGLDWKQAVRFERPLDQHLAKIWVDPFFLSELRDSEGVPLRPSSDPRDFRMDIAVDSSGVPGHVLLSLDVEVEEPHKFAQLGALEFIEIDVSEYTELRQDDLSLFVVLSDTGNDENYLVMGLSTYTPENTSYVYGPFSGGTRWLPLWDLQIESTLLNERALPIRAQFRAGLPTSIEPNIADRAKGLLVSAYPNPSSSDFIVSFELSRAQDVSVDVYNILGRVVKSVPKRLLGGGRHRVDVDATELASGTYFVLVQSETGRASATAIVQR